MRKRVFAGFFNYLEPMWSNFHTHSSYCDGKELLSEYMEQARSAGMACLGFSSHAPLPFECRWCMKGVDFSPYLKEIQDLKNKSSIPIYCGLEVDYIPDKISPKV